MRPIASAILLALASIKVTADISLVPGCYRGRVPSGVVVDLCIEERGKDDSLRGRWRANGRPWQELSGKVDISDGFVLEGGGSRIFEGEPAEAPGSFDVTLLAWAGLPEDSSDPPDISRDLAALDAEDPAERDRAESSLARRARELQIREALGSATSAEARARLSRLLTRQLTMERVAIFQWAEWRTGDARCRAACRTLRLPRAESPLRDWAAGVGTEAMQRVQEEWRSSVDADDDDPETDTGFGYYEEEWSVELLTPGLVSLRALVTIDGGGAHPNYTYRTTTARMHDGAVEEIALGKWFRADSGWEAILCPAVFQALKEEEAGWVESGRITEITADDLDLWNVSPEGLTFTFEPYRMGCYAEGTHEILIPWQLLRGCVDPAGPFADLSR